MPTFDRVCLTPRVNHAIILMPVTQVHIRKYGGIFDPGTSRTFHGLITGSINIEGIQIGNEYRIIESGIKSFLLLTSRHRRIRNTYFRAGYLVLSSLPSFFPSFLSNSARTV